MSEMLVSTGSGEFVHPGELEQYQKRQREIERQKQQAEERLQRAKDFFKDVSPALQTPLFQENQEPGEKTGTCKICGTVTADWVTYFGQTNECICRNCNERVHGSI